MKNADKTNVLIVGGGQGGKALIEMFSENDDVNIMGVVDINRDAPGLKMAKDLGIPVSDDYRSFINEKGLDEIINVTGSDEIQKELIENGPDHVEIMGGYSAKLMWDMVERHDGLEEKVNERTEELTRSQTAMLYMVEDLNRQTKGLKDAQEKIVRSEKLAAIGSLAAGIGHELRNPLGAVKNAAYYIKRKLLKSELVKEDPRVLEFLGVIENEVNASNKIITDLMNFSRTSKPTLRPSEINAVIDGALYIAKAPETIKVEKKLGSNLPKVMVDPDQIRQVFLNIILNAFQAMPDGGSLLITTEEAGDFIKTSIADTGSGIARDDLAKIFEPLFTMKAKGIGLGLAVTKSIIDKHDGKVEVKSEVGKGTTFIITFSAVM